jgi:hypothetical protein
MAKRTDYNKTDETKKTQKEKKRHCRDHFVLVSNFRGGRNMSIVNQSIVNQSIVNQSIVNQSINRQSINQSSINQSSIV